MNHLKLLSSVVRTQFVKPNSVPVLSYHYLQQQHQFKTDFYYKDNKKIYDAIKYGISTTPFTFHSFYWNWVHQSTDSVVDLIHHADRFQCRLLIDVDPFDDYTLFLWQGIRRMYPQALVFDTYHWDQFTPSSTGSNVKLIISSDNHVHDVALDKLPDNLIVAPDLLQCTTPLDASLIMKDNLHRITYIPQSM